MRAKSAPATGALFLWRRSIAAVLRGRWTAIASENIVRKVRDDLFDQLMHLPVSYYDKAETGDLVQRCTSDVDTLRLFLAEHVVEIGRALVMLIAPLPLMLSMDPRRWKGGHWHCQRCTAGIVRSFAAFVLFIL